MGFNKPYLTGNEQVYIQEAISGLHLSGNGQFTKKCQTFFENRYGFKKCFLTTSCTDALEMAAILAEIVPGDEVIMPSFTFVSTANAFVLRGAKIVFCDSRSDHPGMDESLIESLVTPRTKAIVPVHYAGVACDMDVIMAVANKYNLLVIEDAAQAIDSFYTGEDGVKRPLGSIGHMAAFSFHETKNIISGEGGMLVVNDERFIERAEIIWEKGTNRAAFFRGDIDKYGWIDVGSSFLPSEIIAAFLWAQLVALDKIQARRKVIWNTYYDGLAELQDLGIRLPKIPDFATNNAHMFYLIMPSLEERSLLIYKMRQTDIHLVFHYQSLHNSPFYLSQGKEISLRKSEEYSDSLVRLPFYYELDIIRVLEGILN
ncbi:dTDP-4-amino-4,6-dideoxygalactose transaminase [Cryomorpha ignava]|uniref:dTDP-4-amino-4,6-dideoxygalactose transaminase n=1 Tax=Cryomorpha ignava TaxID=101383 RepID=A0A7K3WP35_9FLAO|nr:dTDP-4-amino-4,6-dideoxygalactose transaminase [Cryomorpha ignava]